MSQLTIEKIVKAKRFLESLVQPEFCYINYKSLFYIVEYELCKLHIRLKI